ncbi:hypothetical protein Tco_0561892 [Tanacetum coccineum]
MAYVNSTPFGFVSISPAPEPSIQDDPFVNKVQGSNSSSGYAMSSSRDSSSDCSTIKSSNICPLIDILGLYWMSQHWELRDEFLHLSEGYFGFLSPLEITLLCALLQGFKERQHPGDGKLRSASALSGHTFSPHPSRIFRRCSAMCRGKPVMSAGLQAKTSRFCLSKAHSSLRPFSVRLDPMAIVCSGNFNISCVVDGTAWIFLIPVLPIIPLCWDGDLITMKFIHMEVECSSSPIFTSRDTWPSGQIVSPLNPMSGVVAGIIWFLISGRSLTKQCSYRTSEDAHPSTYIRCTKCPPISASIIIGPSIPSSSPKGGKEITVSGEKLWVTLCLATL